jgi:hypothetical protein
MKGLKMDYIDQQFNKIFETKGEAISLKIQAEGAHTNWLNITEHEAELIKDILKERYSDD